MLLFRLFPLFINLAKSQWSDSTGFLVESNGFLTKRNAMYKKCAFGSLELISFFSRSLLFATKKKIHLDSAGVRVESTYKLTALYFFTTRHAYFIF